ncbi:MAG: hypothetical protein ABSC64_02190 [Candidatus Korobacteraceae bacterium]|jgi:hypothetical protein
MTEIKPTFEIDEEPVFKVIENDRLLIIPDAHYAGGMYRTPHDLEVVERERVHYLHASQIKQLLGE